jgi:hypothetical protein
VHYVRRFQDENYPGVDTTAVTADTNAVVGGGPIALPK